MNREKADAVVRSVYMRLLEAWNRRSAGEMAEWFAEEGEMIGYDGSVAIGPGEIHAHLAPIFENHPTAAFVAKVKNVDFPAAHVAIVRAIAGMVPPGRTELNPSVNTHHTVILVEQAGEWRIRLFQNTPAQFHGRPELVERMTEELRALLPKDD